MYCSHVGLSPVTAVNSEQITQTCFLCFMNPYILFCNRLTRFYRPHILRCVIWDNVDMVFEVLHQLVEFLLSAATLCIYLHLCGDSLWFAWFDVGQIDILLLQNPQNMFKWEIKSYWNVWLILLWLSSLTHFYFYSSFTRCEVVANLKETQSLH